MQIDKASYEGGRLILHSEDMTAKRFPYNFKPGRYQLVKEKKKRSLDSNAYAWVLIGKIANLARTDKEFVYFEMLKRYGQIDTVLKMPSEAAEVFCRLVKYSEIFEYRPGAAEQSVRFWVGSSHYDQQEMNAFINGIVDECHRTGDKPSSQSGGTGAGQHRRAALLYLVRLP